MAIKIPESATEIVQRAKTDVQRQVPASNPFLKNSWLGALIAAFSNRIYDYYLQLNEAFKQAIPDTATAEILERWAAIWGINRLAATVSTGNIVATGTATTVITTGTLFSDSSGNIYESTLGVTITTTILTVVSITRSGNTATLTTTNNHGLASNVAPDIAGANQTEYNGTGLEIQVTALNKFTYSVSGSPTTPATGTITVTHVSIPVPVTSQAFGASVNQVLDTELTLQSPIVNVDNILNVDFAEIGSGTDQEIDTDLRFRFIDRIQNPVAHFNVNDIITKVKEVGGVTRVFVQEVTPGNGDVTIYFMRDNDDDPIPTAPEVTTVKNKVLEIKPANTPDSSVIVSAPTPITTAYTFTSLSPNTLTMQSAIEANLQQFYDEVPEVGVNVDEDLYRAAISNTVDTDTGDSLVSFTISTPSGDVVISSGEIGVLGVVSFP